MFVSEHMDVKQINIICCGYMNVSCINCLFQREPLRFDLDLSTLDPKLGEVMIKIKEVRL